MPTLEGYLISKYRSLNKELKNGFKSVITKNFVFNSSITLKVLFVKSRITKCIELQINQLPLLFSKVLALLRVT